MYKLKIEKLPNSTYYIFIFSIVLIANNYITIKINNTTTTLLPVKLSLFFWTLLTKFKIFYKNCFKSQSKID